MKHVRSFEEFCQNYVATTYQRRAHLKTEVIQVAEITCYLDPTTELSKIQMMVGEHNLSQRTTLGRHNPLKVKKTVFYTGYLLNAAGSAALLNELEVPSMVAKESDVKLLANNVLITPRPASKTVLAKTGQFGKCVEFEVVSVGQWENRIWAALVKPVDENVRIYSDNNQPVIVLALKRGTKPIEANRIEASAWKDPPKESIRFFGTVGEKLLLRIEEDINEGEWESLFPKRRSSGNVNHNNNAHNTNATNPHSNSATHAIPSWGNGNSRW